MRFYQFVAHALPQHDDEWSIFHRRAGNTITEYRSAAVQNVFKLLPHLKDHFEACAHGMALYDDKVPSCGVVCCQSDRINRKAFKAVLKQASKIQTTNLDHPVLKWLGTHAPDHKGVIPFFGLEARAKRLLLNVAKKAAVYGSQSQATP